MTSRTIGIALAALWTAGPVLAGNSALVVQTSGGTAVVHQQGRENFACTVQGEAAAAQDSARNRSELRQSGQRNRALQLQNGTANRAVARQQGPSNQILHSQAGAGAMRTEIELGEHALSTVSESP
jgi:hypothetical protein